MHYSLSVLHQYNTLGKSFSFVKWNLWEDMCLIVRQVVLSFCNCVTMQGSKVSNLVLWARIKKGGSGTVKSQICFRCTKRLADTDDSARWKKSERLLWWFRISGDITRDMTEKNICILSSISERYLDKLFWMRDASVDCVIVLYDWKLIIYSLVPTRLPLLCLPCYCC